METAYRERGRELWALFYAYCNDADRAEDALQEAFTRLHEQNGTPIRDLRAWLLQVGRNWLRDVARRRKVAARPSDNLDGLQGAGVEPATSLEERETHEVVRESLDLLKPDDREVLILRYSLNWSSKYMAEVLETSPAAVDMRLSRARRRLAELLEQRGLYQ